APGAAEPRDDFVEHEQHTVPVADLPEALEITLGRDQYAGRAGDGLDDHRCDVGGVVQLDQSLELVGELRAETRLASGIRVLLQAVGVWQVIYRRQQLARERLTVRSHAADRNAAEADAMIPRSEER